MNDITVIILTKNEEANIQRCIASVKDLAERIIVVDSESTDKTCEIAESMGAEVVVHPFVTHGQQFNWALDNLNITTKWVFRLDADEEVTADLREEIVNECISHANDNVNGLVVKFKIYFLGRFLKHGGMYPFYRTTIFKYGKGYIDEAGMRDQTVITEGDLYYLKNDCLHYDFKSLENWIGKHNWYSTLEIKNLQSEIQDDEDANVPETAKKTRVTRNRLYYRLPRYFRAKLYYWYRYYLKLGFLDGEAGRVHAFLQAYWYRYLIDAKIYEMEIKKNGN